MGIIKIDFDNYVERIDVLRECLDIIPKPFFVRISSGGKGIHIMSFHDDDRAYREKFDDPIRLEIDKIRERRRLINNLLADVHSIGSERRVAGEWIKIKNDEDQENFMKGVLKVMNEYNFLCKKCKDIKTMKAKDKNAIIGHVNCGGIFEYYSEVNSIKPTTSKVVASKPGIPESIDSKLVEPPYFHPKYRDVEKYRCPTCHAKNECNYGFKAKSMCFDDFRFKLMKEEILENIKMENPDMEGVLSRDPSEFEIIYMEDINQKINVYDIVRLIINRDDRYSIQIVYPTDPTKDTFPDKKRTLTYDILIKSLKGEITIGTRPINQFNNTIKWICWDLDQDHNENPRALADEMVNYLREWYGLTGYIELSGSINNYHVWIFISSIDNNVAYNFDQDFRTRLRSIGIGFDPLNIERGVQLKESGMIKIPYNIQRKEKYGHKDGRSRFIEGVDLSKIIPEKLPAPWGNSQNIKINSSQMAEEKIEPRKVINIFYEDIKNNEKVDGELKCDKCQIEKPIAQININEIINFIRNPHNNCGGQISFGILTFETSIEILRNNTDSVKNFCNRLIDNPNKKTEFDYDIRQTSDRNFENTLILKTKSQKEGKELAGWITNSAALKGKLHQPAPDPFKVEKVYDFSFDLAKMYGEII